MANPSFQVVRNEPATNEVKQKNQYNVFFRKFQEYRSLGARYSIQAMYVLLEWEQMTICWQEEPYDTFEDRVLRTEQCCTVSRFRAFKKASKMFERKDMEKLGADCVTFIAQQRANLRQKLWDQALAYHREYGVEPSLQFLVGIILKLDPSSQSDRPPTRGQLERYVNLLKDRLSKAGVKIPPISEVL